MLLFSNLSKLYGVCAGQSSCLCLFIVVLTRLQPAFSVFLPRIVPIVLASMMSPPPVQLEGEVRVIDLVIGIAT